MIRQTTRSASNGYSETEIELMRICEQSYYGQPERTKKQIFNPLNIFYTQKILNDRNRYKVYLDAPVELSINNDIIRIDSYVIKVSSVEKVLELLGNDFVKIGSDKICPLNRIMHVNKELETITIRRLILSEPLRVSYGFKREVKLIGGRDYVRSLSNWYLENYWIKFSKNSLIDSSQSELHGRKYGLSIFFNPVDVAFIKSEGNIKTVQLRSIDAGKLNSPLYHFRSRKGLEHILGDELIRSIGGSDSGLFVQINRSCFVNINILISPETQFVKNRLSIKVGSGEPVSFKVGKMYAPFLNEILK